MTLPDGQRQAGVRRQPVTWATIPVTAKVSNHDGENVTAEFTMTACSTCAEEAELSSVANESEN